MLFLLITKPTHKTANSATLIDNIFTNQLKAVICNGIIIDISDLLPIFAYIFDKNTKIFKVKLMKTNLAHFLESKVNWPSLFSSSDSNGSYDSFITEFCRHYDNCFPLKMINLKRKRPKAFWLTNGLLISIRKKNRLYKKLILKTNQLKQQQYKIYRNKLNHLIRNKKRLFFENKFEVAKTDIKKTWNLVNEIINKREAKPSSPPSFIVDMKR